MSANSPVIIWRFIDGRAGHDNQSAGLTAALADLLPVNVHDVDVRRLRHPLPDLFSKRFPSAQPPPDLLIGAGHRTHLPMLAARRAHGGRIVVLMKPSLPVFCFDLCIIPRHDKPRRSDRILISEGVLNRVRAGRLQRRPQGLIVLGGPSTEYRWQADSLLAQVEAIIARQADFDWTLATSRRTPGNMFDQHTLPANARLVDDDRCDADWLPGQLQIAAEVWVSEDSSSLLYEALSSGARVGVIQVPRRRTGRVARGIDQLVGSGRLPAPGSLQLTASDNEPLNEALRCASWIKEQWLNG